MVTNNYGVFSQNPTLSQLRMQVGYAVNAWNEVGVWGTVRTTNAERDVAGVGPTSWRAINQLSPYWKYKWGPGGADTTIWVGVPERDRLSGGGSLGDYLVGALANVPLGDRVGLYTLVTYLHQSAAPGGVGADEDAWNFTVGLTFYPRRKRAQQHRGRPVLDAAAASRQQRLLSGRYEQSLECSRGMLAGLGLPSWRRGGPTSPARS